MTTQRRIPRFADKLRAVLADADLPNGIETYVDTWGSDPGVHLSFEYKPRHYAKAQFQTDARNGDHLSALTVVQGCHADAVRWSRDPRYTEEARQTTGELASILEAWILVHTVTADLVTVA